MNVALQKGSNVKRPKIHISQVNYENKWQNHVTAFE